MKFYRFCKKYKLDKTTVRNYLIGNFGFKKVNGYTVLDDFLQEDICKEFKIKRQTIIRTTNLDVLQDWLDRNREQDNSRSVIEATVQKEFPQTKTFKKEISTPMEGQPGYKRK